MEEYEDRFDKVSQQELYELTLMLYRSSKIMENIDASISERLFKLSTITMDGLDRKHMGKEAYDDIKVIEQEILCSQNI